jgi:hypothetical protein
MSKMARTALQEPAESFDISNSQYCKFDEFIIRLFNSAQSNINRVLEKLNDFSKPDKFVN